MVHSREWLCASLALRRPLFSGTSADARGVVAKSRLPPRVRTGVALWSLDVESLRPCEPKTSCEPHRKYDADLRWPLCQRNLGAPRGCARVGAWAPIITHQDRSIPAGRRQAARVDAWEAGRGRITPAALACAR